MKETKKISRYSPYRISTPKTNWFKNQNVTISLNWGWGGVKDSCLQINI